MVPGTAKEEQGRLVPISVATNANALTDHRKLVNQEFELLKSILDEVQSAGCTDCWVDGGSHVAGTKHDRHWHYQPFLSSLATIGTVSSVQWPCCRICWVPWGAICGHKKYNSGEKVDETGCPYRLVDHNTGKHTPIIPALVAKIYTFYLEKQPVYRQAIADELGLEMWKKNLEFTRWLKENSIPDIPNGIRFVLAFYRRYRMQV